MDSALYGPTRPTRTIRPSSGWQAVNLREMWRYRELLPIDGEPTVGRQVGFTPLVKADRLAKALGISSGRLVDPYIPNDIPPTDD